MAHTTCLVECPLSPHVNIFLRRPRVFSTNHLEVGGGHRSEKKLRGFLANLCMKYHKCRSSKMLVNMLAIIW